jgi:hypothetical protein
MTDLRQRLDARKQSGQSEFESWLSQASPEQIAALVPQEGLRLHAPLNERAGKDISLLVDGAEQTVSIDKGFTWAEDKKTERKVLSIKQGDALQVPEAGDFEADQGFSISAWLRIPRNNVTGAIVARMDNTHAYRGWDFWCDSRKAAGVKVYFNGQPQAVDVQTDKLQGTIRTGVPFTVGQRHTSDRLAALMLEDLRVYDRALLPAEMEHLAKASRLSELLAKPADQRTDPERAELFDSWLATFDVPSRQFKADLGELSQQEAVLKAASAVKRPWPTFCSAASTAGARTPSSPARPTCFPPCPRTSRATGSALPTGCCRRTIRLRHGSR